MKAIILCAGLGTRLKQLTANVPKVMLPIGGKPLLEHHVRMLACQGITDIGINLHYLPEVITNYFGDGSVFGVRIHYSLEKETILGTAGGVKKFASMLRDEPFWVFYGDNLISIELAPVMKFHQSHKASATIVLFQYHEPWTMGVVQTDTTDRVVRFIEKGPRGSVPTDARVNAGIYILEPSVLDHIPENCMSDFGKDIFPAMLARHEPIYATFPGAYVQDIGTPDRYEKAQRDFSDGKVKMH